MNNLPKKYRNKINIDTKLRSITGITEKNNKSTSIPDEIQTIEDLFIKQSQLPHWMNSQTKYDVISDIMRADLSIDDISDEQIKSPEEFRMCLLALISNGKPICEDGEKYNSTQELWGSDIVNLDIANTMLICKESHFFINQGITKPDVNVNNIILFEHSKNKEMCMYGFTNADVETINNTYSEGLPSDKSMTIINSKYLDRVCATLGIGLPENNIDKFKIMNRSQGVLFIESQKYELTGLIAPREFPIDKPWKNNYNLHTHEILTDNFKE